MNNGACQSHDAPSKDHTAQHQPNDASEGELLHESASPAVEVNEAVLKTPHVSSVYDEAQRNIFDAADNEFSEQMTNLNDR